MSKPAIHKIGIYNDICVHFEQGQLQGKPYQCLMTRSEALQLAKDLLDACGESVPMTASEAVKRANERLIAEQMVPSGIAQQSKPDVSGELSLRNIQELAGAYEVFHLVHNEQDLGHLAELIKELAARMKENEDQAERNRLVNYSNLRRIVKLEQKRTVADVIEAEYKRQDNERRRVLGIKEQ